MEIDPKGVKIVELSRIKRQFSNHSYVTELYFSTLIQILLYEQEQSIYIFGYKSSCGACVGKVLGF